MSSNDRKGNSGILIDGYVHEMQIKLLTKTIPSSINILILQYFCSRYAISQLVLITHANKSDASSSIKLFNLKSNTSKMIRIDNDKLHRDPLRSYGMCYIPNIHAMPPMVKDSQGKCSSPGSLLYRFGEHIECIAFNSNAIDDKTTGTVTILPNNDPYLTRQTHTKEPKDEDDHHAVAEEIDDDDDDSDDTMPELEIETATGSYRKYAAMKYSHKRNSILFAGGTFQVDDGFSFGFDCGEDYICEYNLNTNEIELVSRSCGSRAIRPNICLLDNDDKLFICGGQTMIFA